MSTTINLVARYAGQSVLTTFPNQDMMEKHYEMVQVNLGSGSATFSIIAPCTGKLVRAYLQSQTTTTGTHKITLALTNETDSATMIPSVTYDDSPVATTNTAVDLTLTTTAADLLVSQGDELELAYTEAGTIAGGAVALYFMPNLALE